MINFVIRKVEMKRIYETTLLEFGFDTPIC